MEGWVGNRLTSKTVLIYGGGGARDGVGNGMASSIRYAQEGARVAVVDISLAAAQMTVAEITRAGGNAVALHADVTQNKDVHRSVQECMEEFGCIDILHNNVGMAIPGGPVDQTEEEWDRVIATNLKSMFLTCKYVIPVMEQHGAGVITNISSLASIRYSGTPWISYSASKGGVNQFTQAIALQYADRNIRANAVLPGLMNTPMARHTHLPYHNNGEDMLALRNARCPTGRMGDAWDVANVAVFLASDEAHYISGAMITVDGGISAMTP